VAIRDSSTIEGRPSTVTFQPRPVGQSAAWSAPSDVFDGQRRPAADDRRQPEPLGSDGARLDAARLHVECVGAKAT
jgi:hypothetical protein